MGMSVTLAWAAMVIYLLAVVVNSLGSCRSSSGFKVTTGILSRRPKGKKYTG
jgi:hypothetical protein